MGFCNCSMFCCALLCVHSSFAIIFSFFFLGGGRGGGVEKVNRRQQKHENYPVCKELKDSCFVCTVRLDASFLDFYLLIVCLSLDSEVH